MKALNRAALTVLVASLAFTANAFAQQTPPPAPGGGAAAAEPPSPRQEMPPDTVVRVYYIGDLIGSARDFPLDTEMVQPGQSRPVRHRSDGPKGFVPNPNARPDGDYIAELVVTITDTVAPEKWATGHIRAFGAGLIVSTDPQTQEKVLAFLSQLRSELGASRSYRLELLSVVVGPADVAPMQADPDAALRAAADRVAVTSTAGKSGQLLHVQAGQSRSTRTEVTPIVGTDAQAFQTTQTSLLGGIAAEFVVNLAPAGDVAKLELSGTYSRPVEIAPEPKGDGKTLLPETFSTVTCDFAATTDLPVGKYVLVSRASLDPAGAKPGEQLLVFARVVQLGK